MKEHRFNRNVVVLLGSLAMALMLVLSSVLTPTALLGAPLIQITITPTAFAYLPYVAKQQPTATPTPTPTPTITPTPASELDGTWRGTTSQGREISFTIVERSFTRFATGYQIGGCGGTATTTFGIPQEITGNTFVIIQPGGFGVTIRTDGTFNSDTSASGTLTVTGTPCGNATATWTATKQ